MRNGGTTLTVLVAKMGEAAFAGAEAMEPG